MQRKLTIVVPVYSALDLLDELLGSLRDAIDASTSNYFYQLLLINDNPKDQGVSDFLEFAKNGMPAWCRLEVNQENIGFVKTCNRAFHLVGSDTDVLLLNSDTQVFDNFIDDYFAAVQVLESANKQWASITPFSNSATICSIPKMAVESDQFPGIYSKEIAARLCRRLFRSVSEFPALPVAVGFCMLMNKEAIKKVGVFDEVFSPGYGEEVDWCLRASDKGYQHFLVPTIFVYHADGSSFSGRKSALIARATEIVLNRYPDYFERIADYTDNLDNHKLYNQVANFIEFLSFLGHPIISIQSDVPVSFPAKGLAQSGEGGVSIVNMKEKQDKRLEVFCDGKYFGELSLDTIEWMLSTLVNIDALKIL